MARSEMQINHDEIQYWAGKHNFKVRTREEGSTIKVEVRFENVKVFIDVPISGIPVYKGMEVPDPFAINEHPELLGEIGWAASEMSEALPALKRNLEGFVD